MRREDKLCVSIISKIKDFFGVWEVSIFINTKEYKYFLNSTFKVEQVEKLIRKHKPGKAINFLRQNNLEYSNVCRPNT